MWDTCIHKVKSVSFYHDIYCMQWSIGYRIHATEVSVLHRCLYGWPSLGFCWFRFPRGSLQICILGFYVDYPVFVDSVFLGEICKLLIWGFCVDYLFGWLVKIWESKVRFWVVCEVIVIASGEKSEVEFELWVSGVLFAGKLKRWSTRRLDVNLPLKVLFCA